MVYYPIAGDGGAGYPYVMSSTVRGPQGLSGYSGVEYSGYTGASPSGYGGASGASGYTGADGTSGYSGISGYPVP